MRRAINYAGRNTRAHITPRPTHKKPYRYVHPPTRGRARAHTHTHLHAFTHPRSPSPHTNTHTQISIRHVRQRNSCRQSNLLAVSQTWNYTDTPTTRRHMQTCFQSRGDIHTPQALQSQQRTSTHTQTHTHTRARTHTTSTRHDPVMQPGTQTHPHTQAPTSHKMFESKTQAPYTLPPHLQAYT